MRRTLIVSLSGIFLSGIALWWMNSGAAGSVARKDIVQRPATEGERQEKSPFNMAPAASGEPKQAFYDSLVIAPCNLMPISEQDVSSQVDGVFDAIPIELGQHVGRGAVLGRLDDRQLRAQVESLEIRAASTAAERIAKAQFDEAESKVRYALKANESGLTTVPDLEYKTYIFQRDRYAHEIKKAREDRESAQKELEKARVVLHLHEIRSALQGEIVKVYKRNGEAVKQAEPLFRVANCDALRVEGLCKIQQANLIRVGMRALVEPDVRGEQMTELLGHTAAVNAIAVSLDGRLIASASDDRTVLLWAWPQGVRVGQLPHSAEVTAVAFGRDNAVLTGCADGQVRLWQLNQGKTQSPLLFSQPHEGAVRAVAFSADGNSCATGGEDKRIGIWNTASGSHLCWLQPEEGLSAHQGAVTSLAFTPDRYLVSAGRDNVLKVWHGEGEANLISTHPGRTGEVTTLSVSSDGQKVMFDMGEELRILDRDRGACLGTLRNQKQGRFQAFAHFSPTGRLLLTAASNSRLQLWRAPATAEETRFFRQGYGSGFDRGSLLALGMIGSQPGWNQVTAPVVQASAPKLWQLAGQEVRHFVIPSASSVSCGAFAKDESVFFTGGTDKSVRVWAVPSAQHWGQSLEARITYIGSQVERGTDMVRIRAELDNPREPDRRLRSGLYAVMRLFPETASK